MPQSMIYAVRNMETRQELKDKSNEQQLRERVKGPRRNTRLSGLINEIYNNFTGLSDQPHPSVEFEHLYEKHSPPTIQKAKELLGITSVRRNGVWYWVAPTHTPQDAFARQEEKRVNKVDKYRSKLVNLGRESVKMMNDIMKDTNYCAVNTEVEAIMKGSGYGRSTIMHGKRDLGIASVYVDGRWLWVQAPDEVVTWLEEQLIDGPRQLKEIFQLAADLRQWHPEVIRLATYRRKGFVVHHQAGVGEVIFSMNARAATPLVLPVAASREKSALVSYEVTEEPTTITADYDHNGDSAVLLGDEEVEEWN